MAVIFYVSSLSEAPLPAGMSDFSGHALGYVGLGLLCARALSGGLHSPMSLSAALSAGVLAAGYGVTDEVHQLFVPGRVADAGDVLADALGSSAGVGVWWAFAIIWRRSAAGGASRHDS